MFSQARPGRGRPRIRSIAATSNDDTTARWRSAAPARPPGPRPRSAEVGLQLDIEERPAWGTWLRTSARLGLRRAFLDVELKTDLGRSVVEVLAAGRGADLQRAVISSFEVPAIERIRGLAPAWPCWLNTEHLRAREVRIALELGCVGISVDWRAVDAAGIARAVAAGLDVAAWTVTDPRVSRRLAAGGVAAMCMEGRAFAR